MMIETSMWGTIDVPDEQIYTFEKGIPGFDEEHRFALIYEQDSPFVYMQSLTQETLAFVVTDPFLYYPDYEFELPDSEAEELKIEDALLIKCIITLKDNIEESSLNLLAPLVFNPNKRLGKQVVLHQTPYRTGHRLWKTQGDGRDGE